jgi:biotin transporter BioY
MVMEQIIFLCALLSRALCLKCEICSGGYLCKEMLISSLCGFMTGQIEQERPWTYSITLWCICVTIVVMETLQNTFLLLV